MRIRGMVVVGACMLVSATAAAGPADDALQQHEAEAADIMRALGLPTGDPHDWVPAGAALECTDLPDVGEYEVLALRAVQMCRYTAATTDRDECHGAAIILVINHRSHQLVNGDDTGFDYEVTCGEYTVSGELIGDSGGDFDWVGLVTMNEIANGNLIDAWSTKIHWQKAAPDVDHAGQWLAAVMAPVEDIDAGIERLAAKAAKVDSEQGAESSRSLFVDDVARAISTLDGFPEFPGDDSVRQAGIKWLEGVAADLDHGDLKRLVDRQGTGAPQKKAFKKKTKTISKRWRKAREKSWEKLWAVVDRFAAKHPEE